MPDRGERNGGVPNHNACFRYNACLWHNGGILPDRRKRAPKSSTTEPPSRTRPHITMAREAERDGIVLKVFAPYLHQFTGEPFVLTVSVTNTTGKDIVYATGIANWGSIHQSFVIHRPGEKDAGLANMETYGKLGPHEEFYAVLKAGETHTETIRYLSGVPQGHHTVPLSEQEIDWYTAGEYMGVAEFIWFTGTLENIGEMKKLPLEFPVTLI